MNLAEIGVAPSPGTELNLIRLAPAEGVTCRAFVRSDAPTCELTLIADDESRAEMQLTFADDSRVEVDYTKSMAP